MATKKEIKQKAIEHPMEEMLDITPGTTIVEYQERSTDLVVHEAYDDKDVELEDQFQEVYDSAMDAFEDQMGQTDVVEGKYKARNSEVAVNFLNTALNAAKEKAELKKHKDKLKKGGTGGDGHQGSSKTINNTFIMDRNELLDAIRQGKEIDITPEE